MLRVRHTITLVKKNNMRDYELYVHVGDFFSLFLILTAICIRRKEDIHRILG